MSGSPPSTARSGVLPEPGLAFTAALLYGMFYVALTLAFKDEVTITGLVVPIAGLLLTFGAAARVVGSEAPRWLSGVAIATGVGTALVVTLTVALSS